MSESKTELGSQDNSETPGGIPADSSAKQADENHTVHSHSGQDETKSVTPITDMKDRLLGEFRLLRRLGHGGMAEVYLAEQMSLKRNVAVKVLRQEMLSDEVNLKRFEQEAKAAGGLNHSNIVQVFMIGEEDGIHFIAQEYVAGMNLREYITRTGPPKLSKAIKLMQQISSAIEAAAEAGIVHRDVKPENILVTRKGDVKVTDFGLAQLSLPGEGLNLTQVGMTMGTPLYMSPEQVSGRKVDHRSDIYSFGVTCYHLLGGNPPFRGETALSVAVQHVNNDPVPLKQQRSDLPDVVCRLVHKMMAKKPDDRYQSASSLTADLQKISEALESNPGLLSRMRLADSDPIPASWDWFERVAHWSMMRRAVVFFTTLIAVTGVATAVGYLTRPDDPFISPAAESTKKISEKETAFAQYLYASLLNDEAAWKAVGKYFPEPKDRAIRNRGQLGLAMFYLRSRRFGEAETIFKEFTVIDDKDESLKATGFAGLAVIASFQGDHEKSIRIILDDLDKYRNKRLNDSELQRFVDGIRQRKQRERG